MQKIFGLLTAFLLFCFLSLPVLIGGEVNAKEETFGYEIKTIRDQPFAIVLRTQGKAYTMLASALRTEGYIAYFAGEDFTHRKELIMKEFKKIEVKKDTDDIKGIKAVILLQDQHGNIPEDYELVVCLQIRRDLPCLVVYPKLVYKGERPIEMAVNWGIIGDFQYYAYPHDSEVRARKLEVRGLLRGRARRLGRGAYPWVWPTCGGGYGLGIMTVGMLLKNPPEREIVITDVPPKKRLKRGEFMDVPFIFLPTTPEEGGYKPVSSLYEKIKGIEWGMADW